MSRLHLIPNKICTNLYIIQSYLHSYLINFNTNSKYDKWAAFAVSDFAKVPIGFECFTFDSGLYSVFLYKGRASMSAPAFQYLFGTWLAKSEYLLDNRSHFEI